MAKSSGTTRTSSSRNPKGLPSILKEFEFERETDKAVLVNVTFSADYAPAGGYVSSLVRNKTLETQVWIPKSQIKDGKLSDWIMEAKEKELAEKYMPMNGQVVDSSASFHDKNGKPIGGQGEKKRKMEDAFKRGQEKHDKLVEEARQLGIRGVRKNLKTATLEEMIRKAKQG